jgi:hypothetical protein
LRDTLEVVQAAVAQNGCAFRYASANMRGQAEAASAAVHKSNQTLENPNKSTTKPHPKPNISDYNI